MKWRVVYWSRPLLKPKAMVVEAGSTDDARARAQELDPDYVATVKSPRRLRRVKAA